MIRKADNLNKPITHHRAINLFRDYLAGLFYGERLNVILKAFARHIAHLRKAPFTHDALQLYESVYVVMSCRELTDSSAVAILKAFEKIVAYADQSSVDITETFALLFQDKHYRLLMAQCVMQTCQSKDPLTVTPFFAQAKLDELMQALKTLSLALNKITPRRKRNRF